MPRPTATISYMSGPVRQRDLFAKGTPKSNFVVGEIERRCRREGIWPVIGTDEVGRGPLAGPVVAAAVLLRDRSKLPGIDDSKRLTEAVRERLVPRIERAAIAWAVVEGPVELIDEINILQASMWAMRKAVEQVHAEVKAAGGVMPRLVLVDGNKSIGGLVAPPQRTIVKGDRRSRAIAAASVLAKVHRDHLMVQLDSAYPGYGLAKHKGYPTAQHRQALQHLGPTPIHRRSFAPVAALLKG